MKIKEYLKQYTEELSFIELKEGESHSLGLPAGLPLPIWNDALLIGVKTGAWGNEVQGQHLLDGIIAILGIDEDFLYRDHYMAILEGLTDDPASLIKGKAYEYYQKEEKDKAIIALRALPLFSDYDEQTAVNLAALYASKYEKAEADEEREMWKEEGRRLLEEREDDEPRAMSLLGEFYVLDNQFLKAKLTWLKALRSSKVDGAVESKLRDQLNHIESDVLYETIWTRIYEGRAREVEKEMLTLLQTKGDHPKVSQLWSQYLIAIGEMEQAIEVLWELKEREEADAKTLELLVQALFNVGRYEEALSYSTDLLTKFEPVDYHYVNHGLIQYAMGEKKEAIKTLESIKTFQASPELDQLVAKWRSELE